MNDVEEAMDNYRQARRDAGALVREAENALQVAADIDDGTTPMGDDERDELLAELPNPDDVLSLDVEHHVKMMLGVGGPTRFITFVLDRDGLLLRATYTTSDNQRGAWTEVDVTDEDAEALAAAYLVMGLDGLTEMVCPSDD